MLHISQANNMTYGVHLPDTNRIQLPYQFYSESVPWSVVYCCPTHDSHRFKTGDIKLNVWLEHIIDGERQKTSAFDSIVMVVEPELSIFDFKLYVTPLRHVRGMTETSFLA
jgi:hypothetical protein